MMKLGFVSTMAGLIAICFGSLGVSQTQSPQYYRPVTEARLASAAGGECDNGCDADCGCESGCDGDCDGGCDNCDSGCDSCCEPFTLFPETCSGLTVTGWIQAGYHDESTGLFNSHPDQFNLHQAYLAVEKVAEGGSCSWDWGFRADAVYGVDAQDTQAFGNPPGTWDFMNGLDHGVYGWALPQFYAEVARGDLSIKAGHFYTLHGYEVVTAPGNFFYSHALTMYNSEPFTHTGVLATYGFSDNLELYGGWTLGWDTGFEQWGNGNSFLGGFSYSFCEDASLTYIASFGDFGARGDDGYGHSVVIDLNLTDRAEYVFQTDYVDTDTPGDFQYGINQYLFYTLNDCWKVGGRVEWWKAGGVSVYEATAGLNYIPHPNLTIRPEVRYDWMANFNETIVGIDAILTF